MSNDNSQSSEYVEQQRRDYSLYVLQHRAIVATTDGLKAGARRVLWTARKGDKVKSATLAGATIPLHPHAPPESTINTLAMPYENNIPLLTGYGTFGTRLKPKACGAARYTSVQPSSFTQDVLYVDMDLIPMQDNYDNTALEPVHFLPLVPICLLNPSEGVAIGFASNILPRRLTDIISNQIQHLNGQPIKDPGVFCTPLNQRAERDEQNPNKWTFRGKLEITNTSTVTITDLGYGMTHEAFTAHLLKLLDAGTIVDFIDNSRNTVNVEVKFERRVLKEYTEDKLRALLKVDNAVHENMTVIDTNGVTIKQTDYVTLIKEFTDWRLQFYKARYELLRDKLVDQIQRYRDVIIAIDNNVGATARATKSRGELIAHLKTIDIVNVEYIADLPVYRFTQEEKKKTQDKLKEAEGTLKQYNKLIKDEKLRKEVYKDELTQIQKKYK